MNLLPIHVPKIPESALMGLAESSKQCIQRLQNHDWCPPDLSDHTHTKLAAVLVLLYEHSGGLRVLLTTRSKELRTHAGQTALPGGKVDGADHTLIDTAFREANEEVALPVGHERIYVVAVAQPLISLHKLLVSPVIALLTDPTALRVLSASVGEVAKIFSHPLEAILDPHLAISEDLAPKKSEDWPYESDFYSTSDSVIPFLGDTTYRMHRFRSSASPIKGLTADILIKVAEVAYGKGTVYERYSAGQIVRLKEIEKALVAD